MRHALSETEVSQPAVAVRLEGGLLPNSLQAEMALAALGRAPVHGLKVLYAAAGGRAHEIEAGISDFDFAGLPWRWEFVEELRRRRAAGTRLILQSSASEALARRAVEHLNLFDEIVGRDTKPAGRQPSADTFAHPVSVPTLWHKAKATLRAIRPHQWVKNVLVFVPLVVSGGVGGVDAWLSAILAFFAFSFVASAIYLLNDLTDLEADRTHARKRTRPFAAGTLPIAWGLGLMPMLAVAGFTLAYIAGGILFVALYAALSISYSLDLKKRSIYDVFALAALYTVRMYGGGEMSEHTPSAWLLAFSVFLFLGLALMKRVAELIGTETNKLKRRGYRQVDQPLLMAAGVASSFGACLVLAIYLDSNEVRIIYDDPFRLWVILPLMLFWQLKLWHYTIRGKMTDDPIVFAAKDRISWIIGGFCLAAAVLAGY